MESGLHLNYTTFWNIIKQIGIEIPAIQRDYAQGRLVGRAPVIRRKFINVLIDSLLNSEPLPLDFVYGKIYGEKNEEEVRKNSLAIKSLLNSVRDYATSVDLSVSEIEVSIKSNSKGEIIYLIPLDGQQRLTALFLIHWFVFSKLGRKDDLDILKRFRYKTRKSTELFLEMLCGGNVSFDFESPIKTEIINHEKFSNTWLYDPTVESMLNVLEEIQTTFSAKQKERNQPIDLNLVYTNLTQKEILHFDFLNLQNFGLSDDLYVKMNARGKELSEFENFKAWLFGKIEYEAWLNKDNRQDFKIKFDVQWNDIFWNSKSQNAYSIDEAYLNYFKIRYLIDLIKTTEIEHNSYKDKVIGSIIEHIRNNNPDFDFENIFDDGFRKNLPDYSATLEKSSAVSFQDDLRPYLKSYQQFFFNNTKELTYTDLIKNYLVCAYQQVNSDKELTGEHFGQYIRVLSNLYNNQTFDSLLIYQNVLKEISLINTFIREGNRSIYDWLGNLDLAKYDSSFTKEQLEEEIEKASLITGDDKVDGEAWLNLITTAELHPYFIGKIQFLLKLSRHNKSEFEKYYNKIAPLFENKILNDDHFWFQRALLTQGNYFIHKGGDKVSFCINDRTTYRLRRENWIQLLNDDIKIQFLVNLVNLESYDSRDAFQSLVKIIGTYLEENPIEELINRPISQLDYSKLYIYCKELFEYGSFGLIQISHKKYAYQLNKSNTIGYFNDIILELIKARFYSDNEKVKVHKVQGWNNRPSLSYDNDISHIRLVANDDEFILFEDDQKIASFDSIKKLMENIHQHLMDND